MCACACVRVCVSVYVCVCVASSHTNKTSFGHSQISYILTEFWHYLPGNSIRIHRLRAQSHKTLPPLTKMPITSPGYHPCFWPMGYRLEVPKSPSLVLINLLEWLTELRETFYLLDHWFIIQGYNLGTARWKRCTRQGMWEQAWSFHAPLTVPLSQSTLFTNSKAF